MIEKRDKFWSGSEKTVSVRDKVTSGSRLFYENHMPKMHLFALDRRTDRQMDSGKSQHHLMSLHVR